MAKRSKDQLLAALEYSAKALGASDEDIYEFTRCLRPDGSAYGTRGKCKKGKQQAKADTPPKPSKEELLSLSRESLKYKNPGKKPLEIRKHNVARAIEYGKKAAKMLGLKMGREAAGGFEVMSRSGVPYSVIVGSSGPGLAPSFQVQNSRGDSAARPFSSVVYAIEAISKLP